MGIFNRCGHYRLSYRTLGDYVVCDDCGHTWHTKGGSQNLGDKPLARDVNKDRL
jgi:hypothetical protein